MEDELKWGYGNLWRCQIEKKEDLLWQRIVEQQCLSINRISADWAEAMSFYRFLNNPRVTLREVIDNQLARHNLGAIQQHVLALSDTTSINLQKHLGRLQSEGLGYIGGGAGKHVGFHLHPVLCLTADEFQVVGLASIQLWVRQQVDRQRRTPYKQLAIESKESYKWLQAAADAKQQLSAASQITLIGDREADCYEEFVRVPDERTELLIRSCQNRRLADGGTLYERLGEQDVGGEYEVEVAAERRLQREARTAQLEVRLCAVEIAAPQGFSGVAKTVRLYAIEARERHAPAGVEAILWRLLTTHEVISAEDARRMIGYYGQRWQIEQLFRVLKKQGLDIEASELEQMESIKKLTVLALSVAVKSLQLKTSLAGGEQRLAAVFSAAEMACLERLNEQLEGKTAAQRNPYNSEQASYGGWVIARLGGWKGYASQRPPGVITLKRGLLRFEMIFSGFSLTCV